MRYVKARLEEEGRLWTYRFYVADSLQNIPQNKFIQSNLYEFLYNPQPVDERTGDEVAADVIARAGLIFGE